MQTTKQRILDVAINLFSQYGFKDVTMRQIAGEVGIKASSLYKHYASKENILENIFAFFQEKLRQTELEVPAFNSLSDYFTLAYEQFKEIMWEPTVLKIAKIITAEQMHSCSAREFLAKEMTVKPVQATKYVLDMMKDQAMISDIDTQVVAEEYCAYVVYLYFEQNFLHTAPSLDVIDKKMTQHNDFFVRYILKQGV